MQEAKEKVNRRQSKDDEAEEDEECSDTPRSQDEPHGDEGENPETNERESEPFPPVFEFLPC